MAFATSNPIPPPPPVIETTFPFIENISQIESEMEGSGRLLLGVDIFRIDSSRVRGDAIGLAK